MNQLRAEALLLDVGYVIIDVSWAAVAAFEQATGRRMPEPDGAAAAGDPVPANRLGGTAVTDRYWDGVARSAGFDGFLTMFRRLLETVPEAMIDPAAVALMGDTRAAGRPTGVLSNDAYTIVGREWFAGRPEFADLDAFVDAAEIGVRKPAAGAYLQAAAELGVEPSAVAFLDDTPECVDGAAAVGMVGILVDPLDKAPAFDRARELLGLGPV